MKKFTMIFVSVIFLLMISINNVKADEPIMKFDANNFLVKISNKDYIYSFENADKDFKKLIEKTILVNNLSNSIDDFNYAVYEYANEFTVAVYLNDKVSFYYDSSISKLYFENTYYYSFEKSEYINYNIEKNDNEIFSIDFASSIFRKQDGKAIFSILGSYKYVLTSKDIYDKNTGKLLVKKPFLEPTYYDFEETYEENQYDKIEFNIEFDKNSSQFDLNIKDFLFTTNITGDNFSDDSDFNGGGGGDTGHFRSLNKNIPIAPYIQLTYDDEHVENIFLFSYENTSTYFFDKWGYCLDTENLSTIKLVIDLRGINALSELKFAINSTFSVNYISSLSPSVEYVFRLDKTNKTLMLDLFFSNWTDNEYSFQLDDYIMCRYITVDEVPEKDKYSLNINSDDELFLYTLYKNNIISYISISVPQLIKNHLTDEEIKELNIYEMQRPKDNYEDISEIMISNKSFFASILPITNFFKETSSYMFNTLPLPLKNLLIMMFSTTILVGLVRWLK